MSRKNGLSRTQYDAVIVGSGPNGLSAAVALARAGLGVLVVEAQSAAGGGMRSDALTLPGFTHDVCSSVHPLGIGSPFFRGLELERHGLTWIHPAAPLAHVMDDGRAITLERSIAETAQQLGRDAAAYRALLEPFVARFDTLMEMVLGPLRWPQAPLLLAQFGWQAIRSMQGLAARFTEPHAGALLAGIAAHAMLPLDAWVTASFALVLGTAGHAVGWPIARGGSQGIADALESAFRERGGEFALDWRVGSLDELPRAKAYVFDVTPKQLLAIAGARLPGSYKRRLARYRYAPGVYKMDWALAGPIPWKDPTCARSATVHLSGDLARIQAGQAAVHQGRFSDRPFVLLGQPTLFDPTRAPAGKHTAWAYCHVPHGASLDASATIERQIERFAPGFRDLVLARRTQNAIELEQYNPNYVGGDISGGMSDLTQLFFRPVARIDPYSTPAKDIFVCSSSTPPGGGVHGMCGYWAAVSALTRVFGIARSDSSRGGTSWTHGSELRSAKWSRTAHRGP